MKTLRLLRNIAVLFIMVMALLGPRPMFGGPVGSGPKGNFCIGSTVGPTNCVFGSNGKCKTVACTSPLSCSYLQCVDFDGGF